MVYDTTSHVLSFEVPTEKMYNSTLESDFLLFSMLQRIIINSVSKDFLRCYPHCKIDLIDVSFVGSRLIFLNLREKADVTRKT